MTLREKYPRGIHDCGGAQFRVFDPGCESRSRECQFDRASSRRGFAAAQGRPVFDRAAGNQRGACDGAAARAASGIRLHEGARRRSLIRSRPRPHTAQYLRLAPTGPSAPAALDALALIYWHREDRDRARATFNKLIARFPQSHYAPGAMLRVGRIYEEDQQVRCRARPVCEAHRALSFQRVRRRCAVPVAVELLHDASLRGGREKFRRDARPSGLRGRLA